MTTGNMAYGSVRLDKNNYRFGRYTTRYWNGGDRSPSSRRISLSGLSKEDRRLYLASARLVKRAPFEPHPYNADITNHDIPLVSIRWKHPKYGEWSVDDVSLRSFTGDPVEPVDPWTDNHHLNLIKKLHDEVVGGGFNLSVSIAEMGETVHFIGDVSRRIASVGKDFVRFVSAHNRRRTSQTIIAVRDAWLAHQYAIRPLLGDIKNACETIANINNRQHTTRFTVTGQERDSCPGNNLNPAEYWGGGTTEVVSGEKIIAYIFDGPNALLDASGILDPSSVLWEKTRLSFVADWFLPVGAFLNAVSFWRLYSGTFIVSRRTVYKNSGFGLSGGFYTIQGGHSSYTRTVVSRTVGAELAIPYPKPHVFDSVRKSWQHGVSGVALALGTYKGH